MGGHWNWAIKRQTCLRQGGEGEMEMSHCEAAGGQLLQAADCGAVGCLIKESDSKSRPVGVSKRRSGKRAHALI